MMNESTVWARAAAYYERCAARVGPQLGASCGPVSWVRELARGDVERAVSDRVLRAAIARVEWCAGMDGRIACHYPTTLGEHVIAATLLACLAADDEREANR